MWNPIEVENFGLVVGPKMYSILKVMNGKIRKDIMDIMTDALKLRQQLGKFPKWKTCGQDKVHEFWTTEFTNIHKKIIIHLTKCLENGKTPEWMAKGRTCLILKEEKKGNETSNLS